MTPWSTDRVTGVATAILSFPDIVDSAELTKDRHSYASNHSVYSVLLLSFLGVVDLTAPTSVAAAGMGRGLFDGLSSYVYALLLCCVSL